MTNFSLLPGTANTRIPGGGLIPEGLSRPHVLLRSDHLANIGDEDIRRLKNWNIHTVIDLRRDDEIKSRPTPASLERLARIRRIPIDNLEFLLHRRKDPDFQLWELYFHMLETQSQSIAEAVDAVACHLAAGSVLFHCSAGKDRTGILSALLLLSAHVEEKEVVRDYELTKGTLPTKSEEEISTLPPHTDEFFFRMLLSCEGVHMRKTLRHLRKMGGARTYLKKAGVADWQMDSISDVLTKLPKNTSVR